MKVTKCPQCHREALDMERYRIADTQTYRARARGAGHWCGGPGGSAWCGASPGMTSPAATPVPVVKLERRRGWRLPPGAVVVARPSRWGNPFRLADGFGREEAVALYAVMLASMPWHTRQDYLGPLLGASALACWCEPGQPCHATVLAGWLTQHRLDEAADAPPP